MVRHVQSYNITHKYRGTTFVENSEWNMRDNVQNEKGSSFALAGHHSLFLSSSPLRLMQTEFLSPSSFKRHTYMVLFHQGHDWSVYDLVEIRRLLDGVYSWGDMAILRIWCW